MPSKKIPLVEAPSGIYEAQVSMYTRMLDKKFGVLVNFHAVRLKEGSQRLIIQRAQRGGTKDWLNP